LNRSACTKGRKEPGNGNEDFSQVFEGAFFGGMEIYVTTQGKKNFIKRKKVNKVARNLPIRMVPSISNAKNSRKKAPTTE
jgi:hypothetical protein